MRDREYRYSNRECELEDAAEQNHYFPKGHPWRKHLQHLIRLGEVAESGVKQNKAAIAPSTIRSRA
jgi:hypothetical protein